MIFQKREYSWVLDCLLIRNGQDNSLFLSLYSCNLSSRLICANTISFVNIKVITKWNIINNFLIFAKLEKIAKFFMINHAISCVLVECGSEYKEIA